MKKIERTNLEVKLYNSYTLTKRNFNLFWDSVIFDDIHILKSCDIKLKNMQKYIYIHSLNMTEYAFVFTIKNSKVYYHGITSRFIIDILTHKDLYIEFNNKLNNIPSTFGSTLAEAYEKKNNIY